MTSPKPATAAGVDASVAEPTESRTAQHLSSPAVGSHDGQKRPLCIVGIGASAGGLEPLESFFDHTPSDSGLAFVVVQHLSPDFKSLMDELLARHTRMPIHRVEDGIRVEANAIYLIPPKKNMVLSEGKLLLTEKDRAQTVNVPIDIFLRSLAQDAGVRAIGIVLSGTGSDGSRGICEIHQAGGLVLVQSEESAQFDGMPRSALATGVADFVLPPSSMPDALMNYVDGSRIRQNLGSSLGQTDQSLATSATATSKKPSSHRCLHCSAANSASTLMITSRRRSGGASNAGSRSSKSGT